MYFHDYKLAIETDENGHIKRNIAYEIKRQKSIDQELGYKFIKIDPDKKHFDIFRAITEIFRHIEQSTKKTLINTILTRLFRLDFKLDNTIKR